MLKGSNNTELAAECWSAKKCWVSY